MIKLIICYLFINKNKNLFIRIISVLYISSIYYIWNNYNNIYVFTLEEGKIYLEDSSDEENDFSSGEEEEEDVDEEDRHH